MRGIESRVILDGDPAEIEAALDALPAGSIVATKSDDLGAAFIHRERATTFGLAWYSTGVSGPQASRHLARYCAPLEVLR